MIKPIINTCTIICLLSFITSCNSNIKRVNNRTAENYEEKSPGRQLGKSTPAYLPGDFHHHTTYTDGSFSIGHLNMKADSFGLEWWVNSEHGGAFSRNGSLSGTDLGQNVYWNDYDPVPVKGKPNDGKMWRWQSISEYSFPDLLKIREKYPLKMIIQGLEWNVPGHEHASTAILNDQFSATPNADIMGEFEYMFDNRDHDDSGGLHNWIKSNAAGHDKALEAVTWMQLNYRGSGWIIPAHPERKGLYSIADFRDMNNAGPDVCFGFESMPGHQKSESRGEYSKSSRSYGDCTYGGTGLMAAKVGGVWDAMLSEGRHWWLFANSDFHDASEDFYPGEYQKTFVFFADKKDPFSLVEGLRSGNAFIVTGDLIDYLSFTVNGAMMGQTAKADRRYADIKIYINDPLEENNNTYSSYSNPVLDHVDIIAGKITGKVDEEDKDYTNDDVTATTKVIARFNATGGTVDSEGLVSRKWKKLDGGLIMISYKVPLNDDDIYLRIRGTNHGLNVPNQTDGAGNPLPDTLSYPNDGASAFEDLWFYSNPVFVRN